MSLQKICLRGAHHPIFPLHGLFIYLAVTRSWSVLARAHARAHKCRIHSAGGDDAPATVAAGATFPSSCRSAQRTEELHSPWTRTRPPARAQTGALCAARMWRARPPRHQKHAFRLRLSARICEVCVWRSDASLAPNLAVIPNSAFRDGSPTACAALCVRAP